MPFLHNFSYTVSSKFPYLLNFLQVLKHKTKFSVRLSMPRIYKGLKYQNSPSRSLKVTGIGVIHV